MPAPFKCVGHDCSKQLYKSTKHKYHPYPGSSDYMCGRCYKKHPRYTGKRVSSKSVHQHAPTHDDDAVVPSKETFDYSNESTIKYQEEAREANTSNFMRSVVVAPPVEFNQSGNEQDTKDQKEVLIDEKPPPLILKKKNEPINMPKMIPAPPPRTQEVTAGLTQKGNPVAAQIQKLTPAATRVVSPATTQKSVEPPEPTSTNHASQGNKLNLKIGLPGGSTKPLPTAVTAETPRHEMVSRSGRIIKPKKFADDERPMPAATTTTKRTLSDKSKGSPAKRTVGVGSIDVVAAISAKAPNKSAILAPVAPVPTLTEKLKVNPPGYWIDSRGKFKLLPESTIPAKAKSGPSQKLKAKPNEPLTTRVIHSSLARARLHKRGYSIIPVALKPEEIAQVKQSIALVPINYPKAPVPKEGLKIVDSAEYDSVQDQFLTPEKEIVLGLPTSWDNDAEDKEETFSAGEAEWVQNGENGSDSGKGREADVDQDLGGPEDPMNPEQIQRNPLAKTGIDLKIHYDGINPKDFEAQQAQSEMELKKTVKCQGDCFSKLRNEFNKKLKEVSKEFNEKLHDLNVNFEAKLQRLDELGKPCQVCSVVLKNESDSFQQ